jgi:Ni/Co efflux regulator RcnB
MSGMLVFRSAARALKERKTAMTTSAVKSLRWIALMSGAGLMVISASTFASTSALAPAPAESTNLQVAQNQQQYPPPPEDQKKKKQPQGQQNNQQPQGQQYQGQQYQGQQNQPKTYIQPQGQQYQGQQYQGQQNQPKTNVQPQGQQYQGQQNQQGHRYDWSTYQPGHRPPQWQQYHQTFDPHPYQWNRNSERRYQWEPYRQPRGWYYRRWSYGQEFPPIFWGQEYWINDYWDFGLMDPPYGYVWVRYGPDAMLIAVETGLILSVMYGVFY